MRSLSSELRFERNHSTRHRGWLSVAVHSPERSLTVSRTWSPRVFKTISKFSLNAAECEQRTFDRDIDSRHFSRDVTFSEHVGPNTPLSSIAGGRSLEECRLQETTRPRGWNPTGSCQHCLADPNSLGSLMLIAFVFSAGDWHECHHFSVPFLIPSRISSGDSHSGVSQIDLGPALCCWYCSYH